jgi:hypothetical protein
VSAGTDWYRPHFPNLAEPDGLTAFLRVLHGLGGHDRRHVIIFFAIGHDGRVDHFLGLPAGRSALAITQAAATIPGLVLEPIASPELGQMQAAWRIWASSSRRPFRTDEPDRLSQALVTALAAAGRGERLLLLWLLGPVRRPVVVPTKHAPVLSESWSRAFVSAPFIAPGELDADARRALRLKQGDAGWRAVGRIAVEAATKERGHGLLGGLLGALRMAEGPGASLGVRPIRPTAITELRLPLRWDLAVNVSELTPRLAWPLGDLPVPPVLRRPTRLLPVPTVVPTRGRVLAVAPITGREIALSVVDSLTHFWALGPTGTGKSTLLLNLIIQDMIAGRTVVVIEPKGDLIAAVLARIPADREGDVVLLNPVDPAPIGFNPLAADMPAELIADQLLTVFARLNTESWGPRLAELLHAALLTLARTPGSSLALLPPLLTHDRFRRRVVAALDDPLGVSPIWAAFERLSDEARAQAVASVLNKVRVLTARPALRAVLGQVSPRSALTDVFSHKRPILLADLAKGALGPESARLLGTLLLNQLSQLALGRGAIPPERRHPVSIFVDELEDYASLPGDLGDMLAQARGLGVMFSLANQHLEQLTPALRAGVLANARSRVVFQADADDARVLARGHHELTPEDITNLPAREVYLRLSAGAAVTPYISGLTRPAPPETCDPATIRSLSGTRYGVPRTETDAALQAIIDGPTGDRPIGRSRRPS